MIQASGRRTVPQIFIDEQSIGGFDELYELEQGGELDGLLERPVLSLARGLESPARSARLVRVDACANGQPSIIRGGSFVMSGHSKWSTIKHKKAAKDAKRGKLFTKLIKEITVAAKLGGGDINANPRLRTAVTDGARRTACRPTTSTAPSRRAPASSRASPTKRCTYEGYGPGGAAVLVMAMTDNRNRTVAEIRRLFTKHGGSMGESGCVGVDVPEEGRDHGREEPGRRGPADRGRAGGRRRRRRGRTTTRSR